MVRKALSSVDTAWLRMEDQSNLMMIAGVLVFGAPMDFERFKATIEHSLLRFDRFRQRAVQIPLGRFYWEDDPDFDLGYHLQRAVLPPPGDQAALQELVSLLASRQLDFSRPLWQFHLVERYGDGCALICRLHHSIADGIALVHVLLSLTTDSPDTPWPMPESKSGRGHRPLAFLLRPARSALKATRQATGLLARESWQTLTEPGHAAELARTSASAVTALGKLVLRWPDPRTIFKGSLSVPKRVAWSLPVPLPDVKAVGKGLGGTVNDVLLTAMTGGLRRYLQQRGEPVADLNIRAVVPVNLRPLDDEPKLGNRFGLVFLSLPVGIAEPIERLHELKRRMDGLKGSLEAPVAFGVLNLVGLMPARVQDLVIDIFGTKATAVMTNVMGPQEKRYLAGAPLDSLMFWVPQSGRLGMGVSILSYAGQVYLGLITDEGLVADPEFIIAGFQAEFAELLALAHGRSSAKAAEPPSLQEIGAKLEGLVAGLESRLEEDASARPS
jgi:diacylglycerol O-acyltransferase